MNRSHCQDAETSSLCRLHQPLLSRCNLLDPGGFLLSCSLLSRCQICSRSSAGRRTNTASWCSLSQQCCKEDVMDGPPLCSPWPGLKRQCQAPGCLRGQHLAVKGHINSTCINLTAGQTPHPSYCSVCEIGEFYQHAQ